MKHLDTVKDCWKLTPRQPTPDPREELITIKINGHELTLGQASRIGLIGLQYENGKLTGYQFKYPIDHTDFGCIWLKDVDERRLSGFERTKPIDPEAINESIRRQLNGC